MNSVNSPLSPQAVHLLKGVKEKILRIPQCYRQDTWKCGTVACIAGHLCPDSDDPGCDAAVLLGLNVYQAGWLFGVPTYIPNIMSDDPVKRAVAGAQHIDAFIAGNT